MENTCIRVAVIGAGAAGLAICRHFLDESKFQVTVFEQSDAIGGAWVYTDATDCDQCTVHTSMYKNLLTNLPKELMGFLDFPFPEGGKSFISHSEVLKYLQDYCKHFSITKHIKFNTKVVKVAPIEVSMKPLTWETVMQNIHSGIEETCIFDAVAVCSGHFSVPRFPQVSGMENFSGFVVHSHSYRVPEAFSGKNVAILGMGPSGLDIAMEVSSYANEILLCHNYKIQLEFPHLPANIKLMSWPVVCDTNALRFKDDHHAKLDAIIVCTGYEYDFPFLDSKCGIKVTNNRVIPLYKHFLNTKYPTMALIGLPFNVVPFPLMDIQAHVFRKIMDGTLNLPSEEEMNLDTDSELRDFLNSGNAERHFHRMGFAKFEWQMTEFVKMANLEPINPAIFKLFAEMSNARRGNLVHYREVNYGIVGNNFCIRNTVEDS